MIDRDWLERVSLGAEIYNKSRLCRDFQQEEVLNFVKWLYKQYGIVYNDNFTTHKDDNK